jgi:hypothetical protein
VKSWHRVTVTDPSEKRGVCSVCGPVRLRRRERRGGVEWICGPKNNSYIARSAHPYRKHLAAACSRCHFIPEHPAQLDVHHIDGDRANNDPANLSTLCANCHRLEHTA